MKISVSIAFTLFSLFSVAQINYKLSFEGASQHYVSVEMVLNNVQAIATEVKMPVWAPGSYLVREFAKSVDGVDVFDAKGVALKVVKKDKNTWVFTPSKQGAVTIKYQVYANELSVRTSFVDADMAMLTGTSIFMYLPKELNKRHVVEIALPSQWKTISTPLQKESGKYVAQTYDELVDSPFLLGNQHEFGFVASGVEHIVAMNGEGNYDEERLKVDMAKVVTACTSVIGENPNKKYVFFVLNTEDRGGGLEHAASCVLQVNRWTYRDEKSYIGFLGLVAHEYFHLWNVKRIRPIELGPFNYDAENYTRLLWVMEGFTSYYDDLLLARAGFTTYETYLNSLKGQIGSILNQPGNYVQPVTESSFDAWIKGYRPNENSSNTTISYYTKGAVLGAIMDFMLLEESASKGEAYGLDKLLQVLYTTYYKEKQRGFTEQEFIEAFNSLMGKNMQSFFDDYVYGTKDLPFEKVFAAAGINYSKNVKSIFDLGITYKMDGGQLIVNQVKRGSSAYVSGINSSDELLSVNGFRASKSALEEFVTTAELNKKYSMIIARKGETKTIDFSFIPSQSFAVSLDFSTKLDGNQEKILSSWKRKL